MKQVLGVLAHVDAGKTTFSERALYASNAIRTLGRVDHQSAFLDAHPLEKQRGITIFSGMAQLTVGGRDFVWLDTPGHVDFSTEMERAVSVMDYAILLVSCAEGVQSHTETVWKLLDAYHVPVFIFLNKLDRTGAAPDKVIRQMKSRLSADIADMRAWKNGAPMPESLQEAVAERDEALLDALFSGGYDEKTWREALREQIARRRIFPLFAGSALSGDGVEGFMQRVAELSKEVYAGKASEPLTAQVYQVRHDAQGARICFLKLLSGSMRVKDELPLPDGGGKVNDIFIYHGEKRRSAESASAGDLVAVPALAGLRPGDFVGVDRQNSFLTVPMMAADVLFDTAAVPPFKMMQALRILEEEDPALGVEDRSGRLSVHVMGKIQLEVLRQVMRERFGYEISFGPCRVLYKETIAAPVVGIGHYEPLKHYAEVHLRLVPGRRGSGMDFESKCHVDILTMNWQRLIRSHVFERTHKGVLTGAPLTDVKVELLIGRAHLKHTEGGDFRQAVYRAIRHGLMQAQSVLLEPVSRFTLRAPSEQYGTLAGALSRMQAQVDPPVYDDDTVVLTGEAPYSLLMTFQEELMAITRGRGTMQTVMSHYAPCRNQDEIVAEAGYNPLADDTPDSVFCAKGAGYTVPWQEVREHAHLETPPVP